MTIKGFENEDIEVSEFGEWVGNDYIDYKSDYKEHQKIINDLLKQRQELIDYLKEKIKKTKESWGNSIYYNNEKGMFEVQIEIRLLEEILSKIEKR